MGEMDARRGGGTKWEEWRMKMTSKALDWQEERVPREAAERVTGREMSDTTQPFYVIYKGLMANAPF